MKKLDKFDKAYKIFLDFFKDKFLNFERELALKSGGNINIDTNKVIDQTFISNIINSTFENTPRIFFDILDKHDFIISIESININKHSFKIYNNGEVVFASVIYYNSRILVEQAAINTAVELLDNNLKKIIPTKNEASNTK